MSAQTKWHTLAFRLLLAIADLTVTGCRGSSKGTGAGEPGVMAQVNGYKVMRPELDRAFNTQTAGAPQKPSAIEEQAVRLQVLDEIIQTRLILQQAEKLGVKAGDDEVQTKLLDAKKAYTTEAFQKKLKDVGLTEDDYKTYLNHSITVEKVIAKEVTPRVNVSDADVNAFFDQHKAQLPPSADEVQIKHQIREKFRGELEQILKAAYVEQLRNSAEIRNYYVEEVLNSHKAETK